MISSLAHQLHAHELNLCPPPREALSPINKIWHTDTAAGAYRCHPLLEKPLPSLEVQTACFFRLFVLSLLWLEMEALWVTNNQWQELLLALPVYSLV